MANVVIFGTGQNAEVAHHYLTRDSEHNVVAFTADRAAVDRDTFHGLPVVDFELVEQRYSPEFFSLFVPISFRDVNNLRAAKYLAGKAKGYKFISYVSSRAICETENIGENCFILENNVVQPYVSIGDNVILWSGNHIGHHTTVESHCFVASHAVVSGHVVIGEKTFIGVNATIRDNIRVGKSNVIGAGALVLKSTPDRAVIRARASEIARVTSDKLKSI